MNYRITCSNQTGSNSKSVVVATQGSPLYKDNIASVFGIKQLQTLLEIKPEYVINIKENIFRGLSGEVEQTGGNEEIEDVDINLSEDSNDADKTDSVCSSQNSQGYKNIVKPAEFTGFVSSCAHGSGRSTTDRQFYFINSRPCEPTKLMKLVNEIYRQYNPNQYPFVFLNVDLEKTSVDVNVTPDKRKVFLTKEKVILDILKNSLFKLFEDIPRTLKVESSLNSFSKEQNIVKSDLEQPRIFNSFLQQFKNKNKQTSEEKLPVREEPSKSELKRKSTTILNFLSSKTMKITGNEDLEETSEEIDINSVEDLKNKSSEIATCANNENNSKFLTKFNENVEFTEDATLSIENDLENAKNNIMYLEFTDNLPTTQIRSVADVVIEKQHTIYCKTKLAKCETIKSPKAKMTKTVTDTEDLGKGQRRSVTLKTSFDHVKALTTIYNTEKKESVPSRVKFKSEINPVFNKNCEEELSREISKDSFRQMKVIGQFNLGFIITRLEDDLFIIDQHATDEIYNFETLQKTTELTSQKLVV